MTSPSMSFDTCCSCAACRVHSYRVLHNKLHTIARKMMSCDAAWADLRDVLGTVSRFMAVSKKSWPKSKCLADYGQFLADVTQLSCLC